MAGPGEIEPGPRRLEGQQEHRSLARLEAGHHLLAPGHRRTAVQELRLHPARRQVLLQQPGHPHVLGEHEHRTPFGEDRVEQLVQQLDLARPVRDPRLLLLEVLRGVVADLLQSRQQLHHEPPALETVRRGDLRQRLADHRLVQSGLLRRQRHGPVGLGLRRQLRRDARVRLPPAQQERPHQRGEPLGRGRILPALDRRGVPRTERAEAAEQTGRRPVQDRPQLGEVVLDRGAGEGDTGP